MDCFITIRNDIEGRLDPHFYNPIFLNNVNRLREYNCERLEQLVGFSNETWNQLDYFENEFPYIEIGAIDIDTGEIKNISLIKKENAPSRARMIVRDKDIIVSTTRPNRGAIAFIDESKDSYIASTGFAVLRELKSNYLLKEFLFYALRLNTSLMQMFQRSSGGNYPAIVQEELGKILLPVPPSDIQKKIVKIMDDAYSKKKQNEEKAEKLLDLPDEVVSNNLGAKINNHETTKLAIINSNEIQGRLDPLYYISGKLDFFWGNANLIKLEDLCIYFKTGFAAGKHSQAEETSEVIQVRPTNIDNYGRLYFDKNIYIDPSECEKRKDDLLQKGEVLFNNTNSQELVGKTAYFNLEGSFFCSNHITRIKTKQSRLLPKYLWVILNLYQRHRYFFNICTNWNNQSGVNINLLKNIQIPLPDLKIQKKIVKEININFTQSKKLVNESNTIIENAKKEVEKILFG